jgi:hypothetical protein
MSLERTDIGEMVESNKGRRFHVPVKYYVVAGLGVLFL